jgi:hypothetical protein
LTTGALLEQHLARATRCKWIAEDFRRRCSRRLRASAVGPRAITKSTLSTLNQWLGLIEISR